MPTLNDVARLAGVSRSTVSLVLRSSPLVATRPGSGCAASMHSCGYVYNRQAANLRTCARRRSARRLRLHQSLLCRTRGRRRIGARGRRAASCLSPTPRNRCPAGAVPAADARAARRRRLISAASGTLPSAFAAFRRCRHPGRAGVARVDARRFDYVSGDNRLGRESPPSTCSRSAIGASPISAPVSHIGHRRRLGGYIDALSHHGIEVDRALLRICLPIWPDAKQAMMPPGAAGAADRAGLLQRPAGARRHAGAVSDSGRRPGRDFAVVGFDDIELASAWRPGLSTIAVRAREMGREAGHPAASASTAPAASAPERAVGAASGRSRFLRRHSHQEIT